MVTTLYLIRHGATEGDGEARYKGSIDVPLSAKGAGQIKRTARRLQERLAATARPAAIYCSPLVRARVSAGIIAAPYDLEPISVPELRERHFGVWEGMSFREIQAAWPDHFTAWAADPLRFSPPEGEHTLAVAQRCRGALRQIMARHPDENIVVVAHGGVNRAILCHFMQLPLRHLFRLEQSLACLNVVELWDRYPVVKLLNG